MALRYEVETRTPRTVCALANKQEKRFLNETAKYIVSYVDVRLWKTYSETKICAHHLKQVQKDGRYKVLAVETITGDIVYSTLKNASGQ